MKYADTYLKLADFGRELLNKKSLKEGIPLISKYAKDVISAQRCSIFIYDAPNNSLWTILSDGIEKIQIPSDKGVVGETVKEKKPLIVNDSYADSNFLNEIDKQSGYTTNNLITAPVFDSNRKVMGVLELLNKEGGFDNEDMKFMVFFSQYISGFIELIIQIQKESLHE
jgi:GAF domain-containing protein